MVTAGPVEPVRLRCYAELNDFLPVERRQGEVELAVEAGQSVKDVVERTGVPHTEVDLVVVDGDPVGFGHRLAGGERVAVYPAFTTLLPDPGSRLRPPPGPAVRFMADVHLAALARHLRLLGLDTRLAADDEPDPVIAAVAVADDRVVLTRDRGLLKRRVVRRGFYVRDDDPLDQVVDVVRWIGSSDVLRPFTRCLLCNGELTPVGKHEIEHRLEPETRRWFDEFRRCTGCDRIYWPGSHLERLQTVVDRAMATVEGRDDRRDAVRRA